MAFGWIEGEARAPFGKSGISGPRTSIAGGKSLPAGKEKVFPGGVGKNF
jgi:hypothetical protein